ncbi:oxidoreductase [bacterium endosymbiont of Escarpia laminata]|nr:MAG: oxidoreductase [bacterium endosymbiont of Escarpia laminata]
MSDKSVPVSGRKVRIAVVGCGRISAKHFEAIKEHNDRVELVAVCDNNPDRLSRAAEKNGSRGFDDLASLLDEMELDLVVLTTPSGLHSEQTQMIAQAGCHVMTEKPMATRWKDGLRMVEACDKAGVRLFVVKQNRRNATLQLLKQAMEQKRFGRIYMVVINVFWTRPQSYYDMDAWRGTWEFDGGALMNQASHYVDLLDWLIGPLESIHAYTGTLARDIEVEDTATMNIRWRSGAMGSMNVTMLTYPKNLEGSITIIGEKGTVRVGGVAVNEIQHWEFDEPHENDGRIKEANYETTSVYGFGHPLYYDNVIKTLCGEAEAETDGREGLRSLETLIAAYLSARDGKRVSLPLEY